MRYGRSFLAHSTGRLGNHHMNPTAHISCNLPDKSVFNNIRVIVSCWRAFIFLLLLHNLALRVRSRGAFHTCCYFGLLSPICLRLKPWPSFSFNFNFGTHHFLFVGLRCAVLFWARLPQLRLGACIHWIAVAYCAILLILHLLRGSCVFLALKSALIKPLLLSGTFIMRLKQLRFSYYLARPHLAKSLEPN